MRTGITSKLDATGSRLLAPLLILLLSSALSAPVCFADVPHLVRDINDQTITVDSNPFAFSDQGGAFSIFDADGGTHGIEPWITDGTPSGTFMWGDTVPGSGGQLQQTFAFTDRLAFNVTFASNAGTTVWVTDGTPTASHPLSVISIASGVNPGTLGTLNGKLLFNLFNTTTGNRELWTSDGTDSGTIRVLAASGISYSMVSAVTANDNLYFTSTTSLGTDVWISDGTSAGTVRLAQIPGATTIFNGPTLQAGNSIVFAATTTASGTELWGLDLTSNNVTQIADIAPGSASGLNNGYYAGRLANVVVFSASTTGGSADSLWRTDGTTGGTYQIANVAPDVGGLFGSPNGAALLFFVNVNSQRQLWGTDGTAAGTQMLLPSASPTADPMQIASHFYFASDSGNGAQVWTTDGTPASTFALPGIPAGANPQWLQVTGDDNAAFVRYVATGQTSGTIYRYNRAAATSSVLTSWQYDSYPSPYSVPPAFGYARGQLYFYNFDSNHGAELWTSDGTTAGTGLLKDIAPETQTPPSNPVGFVALNGKLFFAADDGVTGPAIWQSDGTAAGTQELIDLDPSAFTLASMFVAGNALYFFNYDTTAGVSRLWRSDGTQAGTVPLANVGSAYPATYDGCASPGVTLGSYVYFIGSNTTNDIQLYRTDGTAAGTTRVTNLSPTTQLGDSTPAGGTIRLCHLMAQGSRLFFLVEDSIGHVEIWTSDGTNEGTAKVAALFGGSPRVQISSLAPFENGLLVLAATANQGSQLWISDGTAAGTRIAANFGSGSPVSFAPLSSNRFLVVTLPAAGQVPYLSQLWFSDGTAGGTQSIGNVYPTSATQIVVDRGTAYFVGLRADGSDGVYLWATDGSTAGTQQLTQNALTGGVSPTSLVDFNGVIYFQGLPDPSDSPTIWRSNGTSAGTMQVALGTFGAPQLAAGQNLFFVGNDGNTGAELYAISNDQPSAGANSTTSTAANTPTSVNLLSGANDSDGSVNAASATVVQAPQHGTVTVSTSGIALYTPDAGFTGSDSFTYTIADNQGFVSNPASVTINISAASASSSGGAETSSSGAASSSGGGSSPGSNSSSGAGSSSGSASSSGAGSSAGGDSGSGASVSAGSHGGGGSFGVLDLLALGTCLSIQLSKRRAVSALTRSRSSPRLLQG